jgi:hypothetical protein
MQLFGLASEAAHLLLTAQAQSASYAHGISRTLQHSVYEEAALLVQRPTLEIGSHPPIARWTQAFFSLPQKLESRESKDP